MYVYLSLYIFLFFSSGNYSNVGLDLKRHVDEQSVGSPSSAGENADADIDIKRPRVDQIKFETE